MVGPFLQILRVKHDDPGGILLIWNLPSEGKEE